MIKNLRKLIKNTKVKEIKLRGDVSINVKKIDTMNIIKDTIKICFDEESNVVFSQFQLKLSGVSSYKETLTKIIIQYYQTNPKHSVEITLFKLKED